MDRCRWMGERRGRLKKIFENINQSKIYHISKNRIDLGYFLGDFLYF